MATFFSTMRCSKAPGTTISANDRPPWAERLGITQSRVSDLVRGKWEKFSLEMLIVLEARAGRTITLELA
jgi:plasmid maintenance system antidote protein VapI